MEAHRTQHDEYLTSERCGSLQVVDINAFGMIGIEIGLEQMPDNGPISKMLQLVEDKVKALRKQQVSVPIEGKPSDRPQSLDLPYPYYLDACSTKQGTKFMDGESFSDHLQDWDSNQQFLLSKVWSDLISINQTEPGKELAGLLKDVDASAHELDRQLALNAKKRYV